MNADNSARLRDLLANNRTLLAYVRTALSFAGLGFAVAKFGLSPKTGHFSTVLGTIMVLIGQHRSVIRQVGPPSPGAPTPPGTAHAAALLGCVLVCALLAIYVAASA
jgi:putative membrane protein